jgi:biopolymer transport protein ExbD
MLPEARPQAPKAKLRRRRFKWHKRSESDDEIDFTPMIDVTFLLLIYFCVTEVNDAGAKIKLPIATNGAAVSELQAVVFTIELADANAPALFLDAGIGDRLALPAEEAAQTEQVVAAVRDGAAEGKTDVIIQADRGILFRDVNNLIKMVSQAEAKQLHLAVVEEN